VPDLPQPAVAPEPVDAGAGPATVAAPGAAPAARPQIDVVDSTWLGARVQTVAAIVAEPANWHRWWPGLEVSVDELRNDKGVRWNVRSVAAGQDVGLAGTAEIWIEPMAEGVVLHFFLRLDPAPGQVLTRRRAEQISEEYRRHSKRAFWALGDHLDPGRMDRHTSPSHTPPG
jgi:hypothetical protein